MAEPRSSPDPLLYRLMIEQAKDYALFILDPKGHVLTWNAGAQRIKGYAPEEIIGKHFSVFYTPEAIARDWPGTELRTAMTEGRFADEGWRVRNDGSRFWASVVITALRDAKGRLLGFSKITRDLTERKLHEEALREGEERFRLLIESVVDYAIFMLDEEGFVASWNAGAERINGYAREEILGKHFSRFFPAEDREAGKPWEELAEARRVGRAELEGWRLRKDGSRFWARVVLSAVHDTEGRLRGFAKVTQDLSDRRQVEALEKAAQNVNEFIAMLAHELRNPLAPIRSAVELAQRLPADDARRATAWQTVDRQSAQLARIVDDMLDIARITRGAIGIERRPMDLVEAVQRALEAARPTIEAGSHRVELEVGAEDIPVEGDLLRLTQLVTNLLNNAARYTPEPGIIKVKADAQAGRALLSVRDTGRGIAPDMLERIFDMFVQAHPADDQRGRGGLGVGLALARRIAELHGGLLEAYSAGEGHGSEFVLRLPLLDSRAPAAAPTAEAPQRAEQRPSQRVLIVDDNVDAATSLNLLLESLGHEIRVAHDGESALQVAAQFEPDVVLLDIGLPGLDGYEVARRLRALVKDHPARIVAITGWGQDADRAKTRAAGFDVHLVKPVDMNELMLAVTGRTLH